MNSLSRLSHGSRFDGRATASLHGHQRRASPQDNQSSIRVGIGAESAFDTGEGSLALTASAVHGSAGRTGLRAVGGIDLDERPAALPQLVRQFFSKGAPALVENRAIEPAFASPAGAHIRDFQIFHNHRPETRSDVPAYAMLPVGARAGDLGGDAGDAAQSLPAPIRSLRSAAEDTLSAPLLPIQPRQIGKAETLAVGQCEAHRDSTVDADARMFVGRSFVFDLAGKANVPAQDISTDGSADNSATNSSCVTIADPSNLGDSHFAPAPIDPARRKVATLEAETVVYALLPRCRKTSASKKLPESIVKVAKSIGQRICRYGGYPINFGPQFRDLAALTHKIESASGCRPILPPKIPPLLQAKIVNEARCTHPSVEGSFLFGGYRQAVSKRAMNHDKPIFCLASPIKEYHSGHSNG